ncbi:PepSY-associated TM helix domain-containing protein [Silvibacterium acidisoli]|uniref:PepSY-associated TM helix domain-containing protein n=1 Tax=Acidobacteriaceae bacterium ZG23-2 TaxID=2883246 RepID=UPI00406CDF71
MESPLPQGADEQSRRLYRTVWRWHFYAGVFCIPFVIWLACTGSIYVFRPQIERWLDRPYDHLSLNGPRATPAQIAETAVKAVPGSTLHDYELPTSPDNAVRVITGIGKNEYRVYVNPVTLQVLKVINEEKRPMQIVLRLHGELFAGDFGSRIVELAASWAIVLLVSGLYLWWPRQSTRLAGVLYVRFRQGSRIFWRDLHAVTGIWVSAFALFLLLTGLPWAKGWGGYFKKVRAITGTAVARQDWTTGRSSETAAREALNHNSLASMAAMPGEHAAHMGHSMMAMSADGYAMLNTVVPAASRLHLAYPVLVMPAMTPHGPWTVRSDSQNRPLRTTAQMDPHTGAILSRQDFGQRMWIDRIMGVGIAAHEGQLFGVANQILSVATAMGLVTLCLSAAVLWWRRRAVGVLGAPIPLTRPRWTFTVTAVIIALAIYLPAMAESLILIVILEKTIFSRVPAIRQWLGLLPPGRKIAA